MVELAGGLHVVVLFVVGVAVIVIYRVVAVPGLHVCTCNLVIVSLFFANEEKRKKRKKGVTN